MKTMIIKIGKLLKKIADWAIIIVLVSGWFIFVGINLSCAISPNTCNSSSLTWWSMFLSVLGLPAFAVQMFLLRKTYEEGIWKPEIAIGIFSKTPAPDNVVNSDVLPQNAVVDYTNFYDEEFNGICKIIVRNNGKAAAKNVKIQVILKEYSPSQPSIPKLNIAKFKNTSVSNILVANLENMIHPGDFNEFEFYINSDIDHYSEETRFLLSSCERYFNYFYLPASLDKAQYPYMAEKDKYQETIEAASRFSKRMVIGKNQLEIKIWADGIKPISTLLILDVVDYSAATKNLIKSIEIESDKYSKYMEEHRKRRVV